MSAISECPGTKVRKINQRAPQRHTRESGRYLVGAGFNPALTSGFPVALAIASLPGMTPKFSKPSTAITTVNAGFQLITKRRNFSERVSSQFHTFRLGFRFFLAPDHPI